MNIFDPNNPRHRVILQEELDRAKRIIAEENNMDQEDYNNHTLAVKDMKLGNVLYRGAKSIMSRNPEHEPKFNLLLSRFLRSLGKATMEDLSVNDMIQFHGMVSKLYHRLNPQKSFDPNKSALDADSYRAGQGRGGWQGD